MDEIRRDRLPMIDILANDELVEIGQRRRRGQQNPGAERLVETTSTTSARRGSPVTMSPEPATAGTGLNFLRKDLRK